MSRPDMHDIAARLIDIGNEMSRLGSEIVRSLAQKEELSVRDRIRYEVSDQVLMTEGLYVDHLPMSREWKFYFGKHQEPFLILNDQQIYERAEKGPGALSLKIEDELIRKYGDPDAGPGQDPLANARRGDR